MEGHLTSIYLLLLFIEKISNFERLLKLLINKLIHVY